MIQENQFPFFPNKMPFVNIYKSTLTNTLPLRNLLLHYTLWGCRVDQVVQHLASKHKALSSTTRKTKQKISK
jgi:hypothetical protein